MKFDIEIPTCREGVFVPVGFCTPAEIVKTAEEAERLGYGAVWATDFMAPTADYHIPDASPPNWYEPLITLAFCAARTKTIKLGTGVLLAPFRETVVLAKQVATLDRLSNGRMLLGLGLGISRTEMLAVRPQAAKAHRGQILDETIAALQQLFAHQKEKVNYAGTYVNFNDLNLDPKPLQDPLPIYVPGKVAESFERVARFGLGIMVQASVAPARMEGLKPVLERHGRSMSDIDLVAEGQVRLSRTKEKAVAEYGASRQARFSLIRGASLEKLVADNWVGTPDEVVEKISAVASQGVTHFNVLHIAGDTMHERLEQMQMFAEEVIPKIKNGST